MDLDINKVLVLDSVDKICEKTLTENGIQVTVKEKLDTSELIELLNCHDGVIVRSATKLKREVIEKCKGLKVIGRAGTGVDNIDVNAATDKGILVVNTPSGNSLAAAEHTCALICSLSRSIPQACAMLKDGKWNRKEFMGNELYEKVLAVIGLGRIGYEVQKRMKSFGMKIVGYDPLVPKETAESWGIEYLSVEEACKIADYITVHVPLLPSTKNLIGEKILNDGKDSKKIVNVARGGIVDEKALLSALENGKCGGAALDVFEEEPPRNFDLLKHKNIICTPHLGANTKEAQKRVAEEIATLLLALKRNESAPGLINGADFVVKDDLKPMVNLTSTLASLASKFIVDPKSVTKLCIEHETNAENAIKFEKVIKSTAIANFLKSNTPNINVLNAEKASQFKLNFVHANLFQNEKLNGSNTENGQHRIVLHFSSDKNVQSFHGYTDANSIFIERIGDFAFQKPFLVEKNDKLLLCITENIEKIFDRIRKSSGIASSMHFSMGNKFIVIKIQNDKDFEQLGIDGAIKFQV